MELYEIYVDSACDMAAPLKEELGIKTVVLPYFFDDSTSGPLGDEMPTERFYERMREGHTAKTSAANIEDYKAAFEDDLKAGRDILYIGFSSGLSTTYNCSRLAAEELREIYPERKVLAVDSLSASGGYALLVYLTALKKKEGLSVEEAAAYTEQIRLNICHWFTVDELGYLIKGGRMASVVANVGGMLKIKPVMHMDNEGHLIPVSVARGRKKSLQAIAEQYARLALNHKDGTVFINQGGCPEDAEYLRKCIEDNSGAANIRMMEIGPVVGSHCGPGVLALFFVGKER